MITAGTPTGNFQHSAEGLAVVVDDLRVAASDLRVASLEQKQVATGIVGRFFTIDKINQERNLNDSKQH